MHLYLVGEYVKRMTKDDIINFALKQGIELKKNEVDILYETIKKDYKTIVFGNARGILDELKLKLEPNAYQKIELLYMTFKDKLK